MDTSKVVAFIRLLAPLVSTALALFGVTVDANAILIGLICIAALGTYIWAWWKNNNITKAAQEAQLVLDAAKESETK